jgi:D-3-phosphoglycerate dehydrogenase
LNERVLTQSKSLKVISRCGIGLDNVDQATAKNLNILVFNTPDAPTKPVAELTLAHMLNLLRGVSKVDREIRSGVWIPHMGSLLEGKQVGIIGFGRVGRRVAELIHAFGARILVADLMMPMLPDYCSYCTLDELMKGCDLITLHLPYSADTHHIISREKLLLMKSSSYIFNISRGGLIDEDALYDALKDGLIAGAGLDVYESEPYKGRIANLQNVLMTSHMGSYAIESRATMEREAVLNLIEGLSFHGLMEKAK